MAKFFRIILFFLVLCIAFTGCSKVNITNDSSQEVQDKSQIESPKDKNTVVKIDAVQSIEKGTRVEIGWAFPYIRFNGQIYIIVLNKAVEKDEVGKQIGRVERFLPSSMVMSGEPFVDRDGDSNYAGYGSKIYAFNGKDVKDAIIIDDKGVFREAIPHSN